MKLTISTKLIGGFAIVIVLLLAVSIVSYFSMSSINAGANKVYEEGVVPNSVLSNVDATMKQIRGDAYKYLFCTVEERTALKTSLQSNIKLVDEHLAEFKQFITEHDNVMVDFDGKMQNKADLKLADLKIIETNWSVYKFEIEKIQTAVDGGNTDEGIALVSAGSLAATSRAAILASVNKLVEYQTSDVEQISKDCQSTFSQSTIITFILAGCSVLAALFIAFILVRGIVGPINRAKKALQRMAQGDLTEKVSNKSTDEVGQMIQSYNETQGYLNNLVSTLKQNAVQLSSASSQLSEAAKQSSESTQQVATSSQQMAKGAQEQSTNAQETSKSVVQLTEAINQLSKGAAEQSTGVQKAVASITEVANTMTEVAGSANQAAQNAQLAADNAQTGSENAKQTLSGMNKIKDSSMQVSKKIEELGARSAEIGKIVAVIDDIAAQTNLLALNAAIEAARAGEQGRGFAVVSDEVRKLAERTATATKEIADLISNVQKGVTEATQVMSAGSAAVTEGYNLAVKAGQSLDQILKASAEVNAQVSKISTKAQQVNAATNELVKVIDNVGAITEENTAATEQMTANSSQVSRSMETVAGIAEENSAATEEVSASAEEMSAQIEEIVASAQTMKEMADSLEKSVAMFKVEEK